MRTEPTAGAAEEVVSHGFLCIDVGSYCEILVVDDEGIVVPCVIKWSAGEEEGRAADVIHQLEEDTIFLCDNFEARLVANQVAGLANDAHAGL